MARGLETQAEKIFAMTKYFSDLADRETLKELKTMRNHERQSTPPMSEDWDDELRREGRPRRLPFNCQSASVPGRTGTRLAKPARDDAPTSREF